MSERIMEFTIFCIENIATKLNIEPQKVYDLLSKDSDILENYIIPEYDVLHTQSKSYIVDDIIDVMKERGLL